MHLPRDSLDSVLIYSTRGSYHQIWGSLLSKQMTKCFSHSVAPLRYHLAQGRHSGEEQGARKPGFCSQVYCKLPALVSLSLNLLYCYLLQKEIGKDISLQRKYQELPRFLISFCYRNEYNIVIVTAIQRLWFSFMSGTACLALDNSTGNSNIDFQMTVNKKREEESNNTLQRTLTHGRTAASVLLQAVVLCPFSFGHSWLKQCPSR